MDFGKKVKEIRKSKGLSQRELGEKMGITQQTIAQYERAIEQPKLTTVRKLAEALDVPIGELVTDWASFSHEEIAMDWVAPSKNELLKHYQKLNTQGKRKVVDYAEDMANIPKYQAQPEEQKEGLPDDQEGNDDTTE